MKPHNKFFRRRNKHRKERDGSIEVLFDEYDIQGVHIEPWRPCFGRKNKEMNNEWMRIIVSFIYLDERRSYPSAMLKSAAVIYLQERIDL